MLTIQQLYTIDAEVKKESTVLKRVDHKIVMSTKRVPYTYLHTDNRDRLQRPVVVGSGPAGLFCAYYLARAGLSPLVIERGDDVDSRMKKVQSFWDGKAGQGPCRQKPGGPPSLYGMRSTG